MLIPDTTEIKRNVLSESTTEGHRGQAGKAEN